MNGYHKNKGIVIELTALLDVILIMLFWVMMNVQNGDKTTAENAAKKAAAAEQQLEIVREELDAKTNQLERLTSMLENIDKNAADNQQALTDYENGMLITLDICYDLSGKLIIYNSNGKLGETKIYSETEICDCIMQALENADLKRNDVILCTLIYDGSTSLYRDVKAVNTAVDMVREEYVNFYCAYINTAQKNK